jgi:ABC-type nitrate/sulfonate/bicarbonate transport system substrate-binding protein
MVRAVVRATSRGYAAAVSDPAAALDALTSAVPGLDRADEAAQLRALRPAMAPAPFDFGVLRAWAAWDRKHGLLEQPLDPRQVFSNRFR